VSSRTTTYFLTATLALAAVTPGTVHAYRTTADTEGFDPERPVTWRQPVRWRVDPAGVSGIDAAIVERVVEDAWAALDGVSCARIAHERVVPGADTTHADGIVTIRGVQSGWESRGYPADSAGRTELVYQNSATGWSIADADVFLNAEHFVLVEEGGAASERALLPIVLHEMLHVVGMEHCCGRLEGAPECTADSQCARSTMYPFYAPATQSAIGPDDAAGLCWLYPLDPCSMLSCDAGQSCVLGTCMEIPRTCSSANDCPIDENCTAGVCAPFEGALGDPCSAASDCAYGLCEGGRCTATCEESGALCDHGFECDGRTCRPFLAELGEACATSADCTAEECLAGTGETPVCTRACGSGCPRDWTCVEVEGEAVCRPPRTATCSVSRTSASAPHRAWMWILAALALRARRTR
jgi:hypothetical protein